MSDETIPAENGLRILVSNDDGVLAPGIALLADVCGTVGQVTVVAPDREQSGTSHSLTLHRPLRAHRRSDGAFQVDGTPTDCVLLAMGALMPMVLEPLARISGARFELIPVVNTLFGASVTTAGLLPGRALQDALVGRELDLALLPGESVNDDGLFIDNMSLERLRAAVPMEVRLSKDFADALQEPVAA